MEALQDYGMLLRWLHFFAGIMWIGLLWFFNFINGPFTNALEPEVRAKVIPQLMPRTLWWFRWGAAFTWLTGVVDAYGGRAPQDPEGTMHWNAETPRGQHMNHTLKAMLEPQPAPGGSHEPPRGAADPGMRTPGARGAAAPEGYTNHD